MEREDSLRQGPPSRYRWGPIMACKIIFAALLAVAAVGRGAEVTYPRSMPPALSLAAVGAPLH